MARTVKVNLYVKDPDEWGRVVRELELSDEVKRTFFEMGEYATVELELDDSLNVVGGRIVPV